MADVQQLYKQESCEYFSLDVVVATCSITLGIQIIVPEVHDLSSSCMISRKEPDEHTLPF